MDRNTLIQETKSYMMLWKTSSPEEREIALEHYSENLYTLLSDQQEEW